MKRPSFQFYPGDWQANSNLRRCSHAEKGVWLDILCLLHDQPEYGVLRWPLKEIAQAVGATLATVKGLITKDVLKGDDKHLAEPYTYTPRSGRKDGETVTLLDSQDGPIWYSSRMVRDEYVRTIRGEATRFGEGNDAAPKPAPKSPFGEGKSASLKPPFGDGSSSFSSSSPSGKEPNGSVARTSLPTCQTQSVVDLFHEVLPELPAVRLLNDSRKKAISRFWKFALTSKRSDGTARATDAESALVWIRDYFERTRENDFLMGRGPKASGHESWTCDIDFLLSDKGKKHVIEKTGGAA